MEKGLDGFLNGIDSLAEQVNWAVGEIDRLRLENLELRARVENLLYMLRTVTQGRDLQ